MRRSSIIAACFVLFARLSPQSTTDAVASAWSDKDASWKEAFSGYLSASLAADKVPASAVLLTIRGVCAGEALNDPEVAAILVGSVARSVDRAIRHGTPSQAIIAEERKNYLELISAARSAGGPEAQKTVVDDARASTGKDSVIGSGADKAKKEKIAKEKKAKEKAAAEKAKKDKSADPGKGKPKKSSMEMAQG
jgi:hypothetical protein